MKVVDANVLLYAVNQSAEHHDEAVGWLDTALSGRSTVGFSWVSVLAWLAQPTSVLLEPTAQHLDVLHGLLNPLGSGGNLASDAHLAALAIEHRGEIVTFDSDFGRFPGVIWSRPGDLEVPRQKDRRR